MNTLTQTDLEDMSLLLEDLKKRLPKMKRAERVDVAARIRAVLKNATDILDAVKAEIKEVRAGSAGYVNGEAWRAKLQLVPAERLDQKLFKEQDPKVYSKYLKAGEDQRIVFEPR